MRKNRKLPENASERKGIDAGTACGNSLCVRKNCLSLGDRNKYAGIRHPYSNGRIL